MKGIGGLLVNVIYHIHISIDGLLETKRKRKDKDKEDKDGSGHVKATCRPRAGAWSGATTAQRLFCTKIRKDSYNRSYLLL